MLKSLHGDIPGAKLWQTGRSANDWSRAVYLTKVEWEFGISGIAGRIGSSSLPEQAKI